MSLTMKTKTTINEAFKVTFKRALCLTVLLLLLIPATPLTARGAEPEVPDYSMTPRKDIPAKYTWRTQDIYTSLEEWETEKKEAVDMIGRVEKMAEGWTTSARKMMDFLSFSEKLQQKMQRLYFYVSLLHDTDMGESSYQQMRGEMQSLYVGLSAKLSFIETDILKLGKEGFEQYLAEEPGLKPYQFGFSDVLRGKAHILPAEQERIYSLSSLFSGATRRASEILNNVEIPSPTIALADGKKITLNYATFVRYREDKSRATRTQVQHAYWANHKQFENTLAALLDGAVKMHYFNATVHKFQDCLASRLHGDNIDPAVYHKLIRMTRENLDPLHRYLKLKGQLLGVDRFKYEDVYASSVQSVDKTFTYDEARQIITKMMAVLGKDYTGGLDIAFSKGWIDRYPNKGKQQGAYSGGLYGVHPFIKMNYNHTYDAVATLAHELGHALHYYFSSRAQHYTNVQYPTFLAEIASSFNEDVLLNYLLENEKDDLFKLYILDAYMQGIKGSLYRQTHFAEFELAMHRHVEAGKTLTADWMNKTYLDLARVYYGHEQGVTEVNEYIQNEWSAIPHFYRQYYVYTYSTGMIASSALSEMVLSGHKGAREKYLGLLKAGGHGHSLDILKGAGVDMTADQPYLAAFKRYGALVTEMEKIVARLKKKKKL